jgi:hypothetical protein
VESFNGKLRDELLNGGIFYTLREAQVLIEAWRRLFNARASAWIAGMATASAGSHRDARVASEARRKSSNGGGDELSVHPDAKMGPGQYC